MGKNWSFRDWAVGKRGGRASSSQVMFDQPVLGWPGSRAAGCQERAETFPRHKQESRVVDLMLVEDSQFHG